MTRSNTIAAPASSHAGELAEAWLRDNAATLDDFYRFITTPSMERELWLQQHTSMQLHFQGTCVIADHIALS